MNRWAMGGRAVFLAAALGGVLFIQGTLFQSALQTEHQTSIVRLQATVVRLINDAHRLKDDISLLATVRALSQSPGVDYATIVNTEGRVLADGRPSWLGTQVAPWTESPSLQVSALGSGPALWGHLIFSLNDPPLQESTHQAWIITSIAALTAWALFFFYLQSVAGKKIELDHRLEDAQLSLAAEKTKLQSISERHEVSEQRWVARFSAVLERLPQPVLWLDDCQKIVGANRRLSEAAVRLESIKYVGKSWNEVPWLENCGATLEKSLDHPGETVDAEGLGVHLQFLTLQEPETGIVGTWVTVVE